MKHRAFTLIELLVVVAIIVALLAILMPSLNKAIGAAQEAVCTAHLHQLHLTALNYAADNRGATPPPFGVAPQVTIPNTYAGADRGSNWWWYPEWWASYQPDHNLQYCPTDSGWSADPLGRWPNPINSYAQYDYNSYYLSIGNMPGWRSIANRKLTTLPTPSRTVLFCDWPAIVGFSWHRPERGDDAQRDGAVSNIAFADGHASATAIYWRGPDWSFTYNPPSDYDYVWDPYLP